MAAKRLGSALTNITGTSKQLLRVKSDESGFEFVEPAAIPAYTVTNSTADRVINADDVTLDEVADVLTTLINDLQSSGLSSGLVSSAKKWTSSSFLWNDVKNSVQTYTHNLGVIPDLVRLRRIDAGNFLNAVSPDYDYAGGADSMYYIDDMSETQISIQFYDQRLHGNSTNWVLEVYAFANTAAVPFQWSTSEQVWPFEKDSSGNVLYCKEVNIGTMPNTGIKSVAHNITSLNVSKIRKLTGYMYSSSYGMSVIYYGGGSSFAGFDADATNINAYTSWNATPYTGVAQIIYAK